MNCIITKQTTDKWILAIPTRFAVDFKVFHLFACAMGNSGIRNDLHAWRCHMQKTALSTERRLISIHNIILWRPWPLFIMLCNERFQKMFRTNPSSNWGDECIRKSHLEKESVFVYQSRVRFRSMRESVIVVFDPAMQWAEGWRWSFHYSDRKSVV